MSLTRVFISSLFVLTLLAGCGKRGALYMPGEESSQPTAPEQQEQTTPAEPASGD
jgi:predicted small lipoprotein YifL